MADAEPQQTETVENPSSDSPSKPTSAFSAGWRVLIFVCLLLAVGAIALVLLNAQNFQQLRHEMSAQNGTAQQFQSYQQQIDNQLSQQQNAMHTLVVSLEQLRSSTNKDPISPVLVEVDYLARLANYNAQYVGDPKVVLVLLEAAEQRVSSLSSPQLADVRSALVSAITALKGIKPVDTEGVLLRINALSEMVSQLPVVRQAALVPTTSSANSEASASSASTDQWKEKLFKSLDALKKVVVVQHLSEPVKPLMSPEQHINLVENIQLKLSIAQWATLHREQAIYTAALAQAKDWVTQNFSDSDMTRAVITGLTELGKIEIKPTLPDLASMVGVIDHALESRQQLIGKSTDLPAQDLMMNAPTSPPAPAASGSEPSNRPAESITPPKNGSSHESPSPKNAPPSTPKLKPQGPAGPEVISS